MSFGELGTKEPTVLGDLMNFLRKVLIFKWLFMKIRYLYSTMEKMQMICVKSFVRIFGEKFAKKRNRCRIGVTKLFYT